MVHLMHLVLGAALSGISSANSPPSSSSFPSRLNYVPWKQPPAADVEWLHTKSLPQWGPHQTSDKVTCNANHLHEAELENIKSISPKNDEFLSGERRMRDEALNSTKKELFRKRRNKSQKNGIYFNPHEKCCQSQFFPTKKVNQNFLQDESQLEVSGTGFHRRKAWKQRRQSKTVSSSDAWVQTAHTSRVKKQSINTTAPSSNSDASLGFLNEYLRPENMKHDYNTRPPTAALETQGPHFKIHSTEPSSKHYHRKKQKFSKRSHRFDRSDCRGNFPPHCAGRRQNPWKSRSGRTTSRREALVRASLITEDRSYMLKMLPRNRVVGLTLQPGSQHRLLLPVERPHGPLSLTVAPCGDALSWSLTRRPLPKVTETREALDREGQSGDQVDLGSQMWQGTAVYGDRAAGGETEGVTEQRVENTSQTREAVLIDDRENNSQGRARETTLKGETKRKKNGNRRPGGLSENDVLYEERRTSGEQEYEKHSEQTITNNHSSVGDDASEEMSGEKRDKEFLPKGGNYINGLHLERYLQKTSGQYEFERERRTLKNVFSLKNLAFDIGKSDFYDNEANRLLYKDEYDEMLRNRREKREIDLVESYNYSYGDEKLLYPASLNANNIKTKPYVPHKRSKPKIENNFFSWPTEVIFEDPVHIDWRRGIYFDQSKFILRVPAPSGCKLTKSVIFKPLRIRPRFLNDFPPQNHLRVNVGQTRQNFKIGRNNNLTAVAKLSKKLDSNILSNNEYPSKKRKYVPSSSNLTSLERYDSHSLNEENHAYKWVNDFIFSSGSSYTRNQDSRLESQLQRSWKTSEIRHSNDNKQVLASEGGKLVSNLAPKSPLPFRISRSSVSDALTTSTSFQSHSNLDTNSSIALDFGRYFPSTKEVTQNQMKEKSFRDLGQSRRKSYSRIPRGTAFVAEKTSFTRGKQHFLFPPLKSKMPSRQHSNRTALNEASPSLSEMISNMWSRQRHRTIPESWRRRNFSETLPVNRLSPSDADSNTISENLPSGVHQVASRTIWGRVSQYDLLDSGRGQQVWTYARANVTAGVYVLTVSSSSESPVALQVEARRRHVAAFDTSSSPVTAMVSRRPLQPPVLTISWLRKSEETTENFPGLVRVSKNLRNDANSGINKTRHSYEPLTSKITFGMDHSVSATKISSTISSLQAPKSPGEIEKRSSKEGHKQYCLALSEERQYGSLCRARASNEPSIKLGCTRLTRYSLPLVTQQFPAPKKAKRYYVTVWQAGSLLPLGQTSLRGSGRGKVPHLRQGVLHKILLSPGGAATAKFRVRKNPQRLHVAAVACKGGLSITVRQGGPDGLKVVEAGGRSALIVSVRHPPKGLLHLTVIPFTPHSSHTLLIAAATSAKRLPLPRLPHSLTVRADVTSCHSGIITWQSAPGRPKYCVLLEEVIGRPKITWPPIQCGWESKLAAPTTLAHCSSGYKGRRQTWQLLRLKEDTTYTITVLITHRFSNRTLSIAPTVLYTPPCS